MSKRRKSRTKARRKPPQTPRPSRGRIIQRPTPAPAAAAGDQSARAIAAQTIETDQGEATDLTLTGTVVEVEREHIWIETNDGRAKIYASELMLDIGEAPVDRYAVGDQFEAYVFRMEPDPESGAAQFSIRRARPYPEALAKIEQGGVVSATVVNTYDLGIELDVGGVRGNADWPNILLKPGKSLRDEYRPGDAINVLVREADRERRLLRLSQRLNAHQVGGSVVGTIIDVDDGGLILNIDGIFGFVHDHELTLAPGESPHDRYALGDTLEAFVPQADLDTGFLYLSLRRQEPDYLQRLDGYEVGDVVSGTVTFVSDILLWLDVDGMIASLPREDLILEDGETPRDRYAVGDSVEAFVWHVDQDARQIYLSLRRNNLDYLRRLNAHQVGDSVSGTVLEVGDYGLALYVDGILGGVSDFELTLEPGESPSDRYSLDDTLEAFIWQIDRETRKLDLSVRRQERGYTERIDEHHIGDIVSGSVTEVTQGGLWLNVAGLIAWIPAAELPLTEGQKPTDSYRVDDSVEGMVWQVDHDARDILLSIRRLDPEFSEQPLLLGGAVDAVVRDLPPNGISVLIADFDVFIPPHELSFAVGGRPRFERGQGISAVVTDIDADGKPALSHRQALEGWEAEIKRLRPGVLVSNAHVLPQPALTDSDVRTVLDIGPINGTIAEDELDADAASNLTIYGANQEYPVTVVDVDPDRRFAVVSHRQFDERWQELAVGVSEGAELDAELRTVDRVQAVLDLGDGLVGVMPSEQIGYSGNRERMPRERIGERFPVRVKGIDRVTHHIDLEHRDQQIEQLIGEGESASLEFKASLRRSPRTGENDPPATYGVLKSIAGFLNSKAGGTLIIGVDDGGKPITGADGDVGAMALDGYQNEDEMERALKDQVKNRIEAGVFEWLTFSFTAYRDTRILRVDCEPANREIWLKGGRSGKSKEEEFYLRMPASTDPLEGRELVRYIGERFGG